MAPEGLGSSAELLYGARHAQKHHGDKHKHDQGLCQHKESLGPDHLAIVHLEGLGNFKPGSVRQLYGSLKHRQMHRKNASPVFVLPCKHGRDHIKGAAKAFRNHGAQTPYPLPVVGTGKAFPIGLVRQDFHHFPEAFGSSRSAHACDCGPPFLAVHGLEQKPVACQLLCPGLLGLAHVEALHIADNLEVGSLKEDYSQEEQKDQLPEKRVRKPQKTPA